MPTPATADPARPLVLYVEDHPVNRLLMTSLFLLRPAYELMQAECGRQALQMVRERRPALLLLDLGLPDGHGSELLPALRRLPGCEDVPAVAVTAEDDFPLEGSGFADLWPKPLDLERVLVALDTRLAHLARPASALVAAGIGARRPAVEGGAGSRTPLKSLSSGNVSGRR